MATVYYRNTARVRHSLEDAETGDPIDGAAVTITITHPDTGATVVGAAGMTGVGGGDYDYTLAYDALDLNERYQATVDSVYGLNRCRVIERLIVRDREN